MNKSLFCRVGDVQCKQFHFFCSDFKHQLLRIICNVKKTQKNSFFPFTPSPLPRIPPGSGSGSARRFLPGSGSAKKNADPKPCYLSFNYLIQLTTSAFNSSNELSLTNIRSPCLYKTPFLTSYSMDSS